MCTARCALQSDQISAISSEHVGRFIFTFGSFKFTAKAVILFLLVRTCPGLCQYQPIVPSTTEPSSLVSASSPDMFLVPLLPLVAQIGSGIRWPLPRYTNFSGDIMFGALFPMHERNSKFECGRLQVSDVERKIRMGIKFTPSHLSIIVM